MDYESMLMNMINNRLTKEVNKNAHITEREDRRMPNSTRRPFESRMKTDASVARMASQNMEDAESMVHVAQTGVTAIKSQMQKIQEILTDCAVSDSMTQDERNDAANTIAERVKEIERIAKSTNFNGMSLLDNNGGQNFGALDANGNPVNNVVQLQAGCSPRDQHLFNLLNGSGSSAIGGDGSMDLSAATFYYYLTGEAFGSAPTVNFTQSQAQTSLDNIAKYIDHMTDIEGHYSYDIKSLDNMKVLFEEQADIYESAARRSSANPDATGSMSRSEILSQLLSASGSSILTGST